MNAIDAVTTVSYKSENNPNQEAECSFKLPDGKQNYGKEFNNTEVFYSVKDASGSNIFLPFKIVSQNGERRLPANKVSFSRSKVLTIKFPKEHWPVFKDAAHQQLTLSFKPKDKPNFVLSVKASFDLAKAPNNVMASSYEEEEFDYQEDEEKAQKLKEKSFVTEKTSKPEPAPAQEPTPAPEPEPAPEVQAADANFGSSGNVNSSFSNAQPNAPQYNQQYANNMQPKKGGSGLIIGIVVAVVVLVAAGALFYFFKDDILGSSGGAESTSSQAAQPSATESAPAAPSSNTSESASAAASGACALNGDDREVLKACLASKPNNEEIYRLVGEALKAERCDLALRLLTAKGRAPDGGDFAYAMAMYSAPNSTFQSKCIQKNAQEAQYWAKRAQESINFNEGKARDLFNKYIEMK